MSIYKKLSKMILDIFFPEVCIGCDRFGNLICKDCIENIINYPKNENYKNIDWIFHSLNYKNKIVKKSLFVLKYKNTKSISKYLSKIVYSDFLNILREINIKSNNKDSKNIIFIPIPISKKRLIERDYNQSEIIIKDILEDIFLNNSLYLKDNVYIDLIQKKKHTIKFADTHKAEERESLIKDAFVLNNKYDKSFFKEKIIILIDDITTTGSTFYEARKTLINFGIKKENIFGYALAH